MSLTPELDALRREILGYARESGLDPFDTIFELIDSEQMDAIASYGGFPTRYPHWRFGMEYDQLSKSSSYGLSKIYEMVINTDPAYAYLLEGNRLVDQKIVMAHVYGHVDFFRHNHFFSRTNRKMVDQMANHATRVRRLIDRLGVEKVERFIDTALSLDNLIDVHGAFIARPSRTDQGELPDARTVEAGRLPSERGYMERFINPPEVIARERAERVAALEQQKHRFPRYPERDVLQFLIEHAPLESWEVELLGIIRDEAMYFAPQGMTKIMNEGWASYWHSRILTERALRDDEIIDFAEIHAGVVATAPGRLNPYKLGIELWRDIEHRWDRGMFGAEWEDCDSLAEREAWDRQTGLGQDKLFEVRRLYNDITFLDEFLTREFVERQRMYAFGYDPKDRQWEITSREFDDVKRTLLDQLTNFGQPVIEVVDANFRNRAELLLRHVFLGEPLRLDAARETLVNLHRVWRRPVHVATVIDGKGTLLGFDGTDHEQRDWDDEDT